MLQSNFTSLCPRCDCVSDNWPLLVKGLKSGYNWDEKPDLMKSGRQLAKQQSKIITKIATVQWVAMEIIALRH